MQSSTSSPEDQLPISRRFFKVFVPGFHTKLKVPVDFSLKLKGEKAERGTLKVREGTWDVEIERSSNGEIWFCKGWEEFVQDHKLDVADFAVFEHLGNMNFIVTLLDSCGCQKKPLQPKDDGPKATVGKRKTRGSKAVVSKVKSAKPQKEKKKQDGDEPFNQYVKGSSEFKARIKEYNVRRRSPYMHIPMEFCHSNEIFQNTTIRLTGPSGKLCPVSLKICYGGKTLYACMTSGWRAFFSSNELKVGDVCTFQLDPTKSDPESIAIDVRVT